LARENHEAAVEKKDWMPEGAAGAAGASAEAA
jgi:hypothetical protein